MNKNILVSLAIIGAVAAIAIGGTVAYFSDTETSTGNTISAGVVDIVVNEQNPWHDTFTEELKDMKPCQTRYIEFTVRNLEYSNPIELWKHIEIVEQRDGVITEPECTEGGGTWTGSAYPCTNPDECCTGDYEPRNNIASYILYDMYVCEWDGTPNKCRTDDNGAPVGNDWDSIITEDQYVRLDNVGCCWIYLGQLDPGNQLKVVQSYHLSSWPDAPEPEVGNWAQGDELTFNIELYAEQVSGPGPDLPTMVTLDNKDPVTWKPINDEYSAVLTFNPSGPTFNYELEGKVKQENTEYCLIYYADPWPGNHPGALIGKASSDADGKITMSGNPDLGIDMPDPADANNPAGAKIWLVPCSNYNECGYNLTAWNPDEYLFEMRLIKY
ncbi:MAG: hypothetical protein DRP15_01375, partial [Candidatus Aenigmatarchaeota archaeon]